MPPLAQGFYQPDGGPLLDMGPYYLTALVNLLGPVQQALGLQATLQPTRTIGSGPRAGQTFTAAVPTHVAALLTFEQGQVATLVTSFDVQATRTPHLEVYGTDATLVLPDPNFYDGVVSLRRRGDQGWRELPAGRPPPPTAGQPSSPPGGRGLGVLDLARALRGHDQQRATGELGHHALDVMLAIRRSATRGQADRVASSCPQPAPR